MNTSRIKFVSSVLFVRDLEVSRKFYEGLLGQKVLTTTDPNGRRLYAQGRSLLEPEPLLNLHVNLALGSLKVVNI